MSRSPGGACALGRWGRQDRFPGHRWCVQGPQRTVVAQRNPHVFQGQSQSRSFFTAGWGTGERRPTPRHTPRNGGRRRGGGGTPTLPPQGHALTIQKGHLPPPQPLPTARAPATHTLPRFAPPLTSDRFSNGSCRALRTPFPSSESMPPTPTPPHPTPKKASDRKQT